MTLSQIFAASIQAMVQGDTVRMAELAQLQEQKIAELKKNKKTLRKGIDKTAKV